MMHGTEMMGSGSMMFGMGLFMFLWIAIGSFIFSIIFWKTYTWLVKGKKK